MRYGHRLVPRRIGGAADQTRLLGPRHPLRGGSGGHQRLLGELPSDLGYIADFTGQTIHVNGGAFTTR